MLMKPYLLPSDKNLCGEVGGGGGAGGEGKWGWKNGDYHMYDEHDARFRFFYRVSDLWADVLSSKHWSWGSTHTTGGF